MSHGWMLGLAGGVAVAVVALTALAVAEATHSDAHEWEKASVHARAAGLRAGSQDPGELQPRHGGYAGALTAARAAERPSSEHPSAAADTIASAAGAQPTTGDDWVIGAPRSPPPG